jgi:hypothetical protein
MRWRFAAPSSATPGELKTKKPRLYRHFQALFENGDFQQPTAQYCPQTDDVLPLTVKM